MSHLAEDCPSLDTLISQAKSLYNETFGHAGDGDLVCGVAPGRVNLIGEHTDYNDGYVLPMALPLLTVVVGATSNDNSVAEIVTSSSVGDTKPVEVRLDEPLTPGGGHPKWANYVKGVMASFPNVRTPTSSSGSTTDIKGFKAAIVSSVPVGGGVSSSAALEVAFHTFLEALTGKSSTTPSAKALACQKAEHDFAGMPCGIMDQFVSVMASEGSALLIDCRSQEVKNVPLNSEAGVSFFVTNSNVKHELTGSEYPTRRAQCEEAAQILGRPSLRTASEAEVMSAKKEGRFSDPVVHQRALHVVTEIQRTEAAAVALEASNFEEFGRLMVQSHNSLRDHFEVSCPELDELVELALSCEGVLGSRMTGGGFGGCTVTLVKTSALPRALETIKNGYKGTPTFYICGSPRAGARTVKI